LFFSIRRGRLHAVGSGFDKQVCGKWPVSSSLSCRQPCIYSIQQESSWKIMKWQFYISLSEQGGTPQ
jgi:hypothetical protein